MASPPLRISLLALLMTALSSWLAAQISGKIVDDTGAPLEYATAVLYHSRDSSPAEGTVTDEQGLFYFENLKKGNYFLIASFIGYQSQTLNDLLLDNNQSSLALGAIALRLGNQLDEVLVTENRSTVLNKIDRQVFDAKKFQSAQGGTAIDVIRNLPSVSVDGQGMISVRGASGFVILINGKPVQGDPTALLGQIPANAVESVEVITAPSAKYDPEGKAGVINILMRKGATDGAFAQINLRAGLPSIEDYDNVAYHQRYGLDATYNIIKGKWNVSLGGSFQRNDLGGKRVGDVYTILRDTFTRYPSTGERSMDEVNASGRFTVDFTPNENNGFSLGFFGGKRKVDRLADIVYFDNHAFSPANSSNRLYTFQYFNHNLRTRTGDFALGSLDYNHTFRNTSRISTSLLYEYTLLGGPTINQNLGHPDNRIVYQDEYNTNDNPLYGFRYQLDYAFKPFAFGTLETGYQFRDLLHVGDFVYERRNNTTGVFELVPEFSSEVDLKRSIHSGYLQLSGKKGKWSYAAGARLEAMNRDFDLRDKSNTVDTTFEYDFVKLFPSASFQYALSESVNVKAAYSKRIERTTTFKMNPFPEREHSETLEQGDANLLPEFIDLVELGLTKIFEKGHSVYATAYFRNVQNLVNRVNTVYNDSILNRIYTNVGASKALGMEIGASFNPTKNWTNFIGANVYRFGINGSFDNREVNTQATLYSFNINSTVKFWKTASAQFTLNYLSERNTAQGEDSRYYLPNLTLRKSFLDQRLAFTLQWLNMDLGLLETNEQRITTYRTGEFFTTTNYVHEVDMIVLNLSYTFKNGKNRSKFIKSEFGEREF